MAKMTKAMWDEIEFFSTDENWGNPLGMEAAIIYELDALRKYLEHPIRIHCGHELRSTGGFHCYGMAVDFHVTGMDLIDQFFEATRFDGFNGIGIYPYWNNPGLHVDCRSKPQRYFADARWISPSNGVYVPLNRANMREYFL